MSPDGPDDAVLDLVDDVGEGILELRRQVGDGDLPDHVTDLCAGRPDGAQDRDGQDEQDAERAEDWLHPGAPSGRWWTAAGIYPFTVRVTHASRVAGNGPS
jgi:hypothetical protein